MPATNRKTLFFIALVVFSNAIGNFLLSVGMKQQTAMASLLAPLLNPWVIAGIALLILWTMSRMALLSWADLSYVLPVTSIGYVLNALMAVVLLHETLTTERWMGTLMITAGTVLTGLGRPRS